MKLNLENEYEYMEEWEEDAYFLDKEDWQGLVKLRYQRVERHPELIYYQWELGEAYVLNREYEKAISFLSDLHIRVPEDINIQHSLLQALLESGKDETAVDWIIQPEVLKLNEEVLDFLYNFLRSKRKPRSVNELYIECYGKGYPMFNDKQLMSFLCTDDRFIVTGSKEWIHDCFISVNRKKNGKMRNAEQ